MRTLRRQKLARLGQILRHPKAMAPYSFHLLRGLVTGGDRDAMMSDPEGQAMFPARIFYTINSGCNLKCRMCDVGSGDQDGIYYRNTMRKRSDYLTLVEVEAFAESLLPHRPEVILNGTEPTTHPELPGIIRAFTSRGMRCEVYTNAVLLDRWIEPLLDSGLSQLLISLDGHDAATHDGIRGVPGTFEKATRNLNAFIDARDRRGRAMPLVVLAFVVQPSNCDKLLPMVEWAVKQRVDALTFAHMEFATAAMSGAHNAAFPQYPMTRTGTMRLDPGDVDPERLYAQLAEISRRFGDYPIYALPDLGTRESLLAYYRRHDASPKSFGYDHCSALYHSIQLYPNGDVNVASTCFTTPLGNVRETSLGSIWNGLRYREFRKAVRGAGGLMPGCGRCNYVACTVRLSPSEFLAGSGRLVREA